LFYLEKGGLDEMESEQEDEEESGSSSDEEEKTVKTAKNKADASKIEKEVCVNTTIYRYTTIISTK